jgi:hypothetical protein
MLLGTLVQTIVLLFITVRTDWDKQVSFANCWIITVLKHQSSYDLLIKTEVHCINIYWVLDQCRRYTQLWFLFYFQVEVIRQRLNKLFIDGNKEKAASGGSPWDQKNRAQALNRDQSRSCILPLIGFCNIPEDKHKFSSTCQRMNPPEH